ncbi:protein of unknown function [Methylorubrum extorquens DM4]|uniref:Uncharacterized protein n=1 Tax=Methylorubrum extorquens (strain DSM 6343 / CIP 106787 / DM4) TaxID=661410 RepID=C7CJ31_METED|nr:protein of unknown function [Methylorubrum extorquens DM4]
MSRRLRPAATAVTDRRAIRNVPRSPLLRRERVRLDGLPGWSGLSGSTLSMVLPLASV